MAVRILAGARDLGRGDHPAVLAAHAQRLAPGLCDPADQFLVDRAREDHFGDLRGGLVGHPQAVDERALDPELLEHRADLRTAAVDHHGVDPHRLEQDHVLGKVARGLGVAHRVAAVLHHEGAPGVALEIGQRLDQSFRLGQHRLGIAGHISLLGGASCAGA